MTLGSVFADGHAVVLTVGKDGTNPITAGSVCVRDTASTPKSYKQAPASAGNLGPFVVCVNRDAAATDRAFAAAFPGSLVTVKAQGAIDIGQEVQCSSSVSGAVAAFALTTLTGAYVQADQIAAQNDRLRVVGRYIGHENEMQGAGTTGPGSAAADGDLIVIRIGGN